MSYRVAVQRETKCVCLIVFKNKQIVWKKCEVSYYYSRFYVYLWRRVLLVTVYGKLITIGVTSSYSRLRIFTTGGIFSCKRWYVFVTRDFIFLFNMWCSLFIFTPGGIFSCNRCYVLLQQILYFFLTCGTVCLYLQQVVYLVATDVTFLLQEILYFFLTRGAVCLYLHQVVYLVATVGNFCYKRFYISL